MGRVAGAQHASSLRGQLYEQRFRDRMSLKAGEMLRTYRIPSNIRMEIQKAERALGKAMDTGEIGAVQKAFLELVEMLGLGCGRQMQYLERQGATQSGDAAAEKITKERERLVDLLHETVAGIATDIDAELAERAADSGGTA